MHSESRLRSGPPKPEAKAAFTLIELLVIVAVISLIAGLLMPAMPKATQAARPVQCLSQMRQIGMAVRLYANDNEDHVPRSQHSAFAHNQMPWGRAIAEYVGAKPSSWTNLLNGLYRCPKDLRKEPWLWGYGQKSNYSFADGHAQLREFSQTNHPESQTDLWNPSKAQ